MIIIFMKKNKNIDMVSDLIYRDDELIISYDNITGWSFEIDNKIHTSDPVEAVSYMMRKKKKFRNQEIWTFPLKNFKVNPYKSLFWLSGGSDTWDSPEYNLNWHVDSHNIVKYVEKDIMICEEFTSLIQIRKYIKSKLNLDVFMDVIYRYKLFNHL